MVVLSGLAPSFLLAAMPAYAQPASSFPPPMESPLHVPPGAPPIYNLAGVAPGCTSDRDCKGDRVCVADRCVSPGSGDFSGSMTSLDVPVKDASIGLYANSLGVLQFGVSPTIEFGKRFVFNAKVIFFNTGAASYLIASDDTLHFSYGVGPGCRYYFGEVGNVRGFYLGAETLFVAWEEQYQQSTVYKTKLVVPLAEIGYRWVRASGFSIGLGATFGSALVIDKTSEAVNRETPGGNNASDQALAFVHLDLGLVL
jgi:hypothetical protein